MAPHNDGEALSGPGVIEHGGEQYLSIERAGEYLGKARATLFTYISRFGWQTYKFPLEGKRVYLKKSDLDALRNAGPQPKKLTPPKSNRGGVVEEPCRIESESTSGTAY